MCLVDAVLPGQVPIEDLRYYRKRGFGLSFHCGNAKIYTGFADVDEEPFEYTEEELESINKINKRIDAGELYGYDQVREALNEICPFWRG